MQEKLENILFTAIIIPKGRIKASFIFSAFGYLNKIFIFWDFTLVASV